MMKPKSLVGVSIYSRSQKAAREFYVRKIGLKVRETIPEWGYLALGANKGGEDASVNIWEPTREMWGDTYDEIKDQVGVVTGIGFRTGDLKGTVEALKRRKVKVDWSGEDNMANVTDPEGNSFFIVGPLKPKRRKPGLQSLEFVTIVTRDWKRSGNFWTKSVGMRRGREVEEGFWPYRLSPRGTSIAPFTPVKGMYENPLDYEYDMKHIGEYTGMYFETDDIFKLQKEMFDRGVVFRRKAEKAEWGGIDAEFLDPDKNVYGLMQPPR